MRSVGWDVTFVQYDDGPPEGYDAEPTDLVELARGFFHYFGEEFDVERDIVSIWAGEPLERRREYGELQQEMARKQQEQSEEMKRRAANLAGEAGTDHGVLSFEEEKRQEDEDALLGAFAADQTVSLEQQQHPPRPDSQASDPMEYLEFEEPERWSDHLLVVQDPFILTRNCAGNVQEDWVEELRVVRFFPSPSLPFHPSDRPRSSKSNSAVPETSSTRMPLSPRFVPTSRQRKGTRALRSGSGWSERRGGEQQLS